MPIWTYPILPVHCRCHLQQLLYKQPLLWLPTFSRDFEQEEEGKISESKNSRCKRWKASNKCQGALTFTSRSARAAIRIRSSFSSCCFYYRHCPASVNKKRMMDFLRVIILCEEVKISSNSQRGLTSSSQLLSLPATAAPQLATDASTSNVNLRMWTKKTVNSPRVIIQGVDEKP